jgi:DNA polymerase-1
MKYKNLYLDFEFSCTNEKLVNVVSCATVDDFGDTRKWWLHHDSKTKAEFKKYLKQFSRMIAYAAVAECRAFIGIELEPLDVEWIDLFIEYRCLTNHNDKLQWGEQLVDGKVKKVHKPRPKWDRIEGENLLGFSATHSLAEASFKLLGVQRDTVHKKVMRDLIISNCSLYREEEVKAILDYGVDDVQDLPKMYKEIRNWFQKLDPIIDMREWEKEAMFRGRYSAHTAHMESRGYPIDFEKTMNFSNQVGNILFDVQREISQLFPEINAFSWDKKLGRFKMNQSNIRAWILRFHSDKNWVKTDTGLNSLSLEAFTRHFDFKHDYPKDNFGAQIVRLLKLKQQIFGFQVSKDSSKRNFWDSVGSDKRVRPYMNIFKAQSSRSQPASTGFMFLKPAWVRALVQEEPGWAIGGIDYSSEEFLISAVMAEDKGMIDAYKSGDVYLAFAKDAGMVPRNGTKEEYKRERDICKATVLGISYLMTKYGLAVKLSSDTGEVWTEDEAQEMINKFYDSYENLDELQDHLTQLYAEQKYLKLPCGWYMFGDNDNFRSVVNMNIQGIGASIMRKAVDLCYDKGLEVLFTLHDAIYIRYKVGEETKMKLLADAMREAFIFYWPEELKADAGIIRLDAFSWSRDYPADSEIDLGTMKLPVSNLYVDDRSLIDYAAFSKYFDRRAEDDL